MFTYKEKLTLKKGICVMIALLGMVFISGILEGQLPQTSEALGIVFGLLAAILYAVVVMLNKKLPGIDPYQKTIIQLFSAGIVLVPYVWLQTDFTMIHLNGIEWILLLFVGFVHTGIAYTLYFGSVDEIKAQTVALFSYIDPVIALILSFVILHEPMTFYGILGAICILGATIVSEL